MEAMDKQAYQIVDAMEVLGAMISHEGDTITSVEHRLGKAEGKYWSNAGTYKAKGSIASKMKAWPTGPAASAAHGSSTWHLAQNVMVRLRRWEFSFLRKMFGFRRRPGEGQAMFMTRTARLMERWFRVTGTRPLHLRVLRDVFKAAWREQHLAPHDGANNFLSTARQARSRLWWETAKHTCSRKRRRKEGIVHSGYGHRVEWEDVLVQAYGEQWREKRNACSTMVEWMALYPEFEKHICGQWELFTISEQALATATDQESRVWAKRQRTSAYPLELLPTSHGGGAPEIPWESVSGRFAFVTDCQPLSAVVNGLTVLTNGSLEPVLCRITRNIFSLLEREWKPARDIDDAVVWRPRDYNKIADYLVNHTMDERKSWAKTFPDSATLSCAANFLVHFDGGTRAGQCSAAAWCIEALTVCGQSTKRSFVIQAGTFMSDPVSSFLAETIAMDEAVQALAQILSFRARPLRGDLSPHE